MSHPATDHGTRLPFPAGFASFLARPAVDMESCVGPTLFGQLRDRIAVDRSSWAPPMMFADHSKSTHLQG